MNLTISDTAIDLGIFALDREIENGTLEIYPAVPRIVPFEKPLTVAA